MKKKAEIFWFAIFVATNFAMLFQVIKTTNSPAYKRGVYEYSKLVTDPLR